MVAGWILRALPDFTAEVQSAQGVVFYRVETSKKARRFPSAPGHCPVTAVAVYFNCRAFFEAFF